MKVLVVDDDAISLAVLEHTLTRAGYEVVLAGDGREALELLRSQGIQLVVSDWGMPNMNGVELCRAIRAPDFSRYVYFILLTSHCQPQDTLDGLEAGADDFIVKPVNPMELTLRVNVGRRTVALDTRDLAIFAMGKLAESRDSETGTHLARISNYCRALARRIMKMNLAGYDFDEEFVQLIYRTSPMHDIGKIAVPDCILQKPGRLDDVEFQVMKMHTMFGARMLDAALREFPNAGFLKMARNIALFHHERYDGSGYPQAIAGDAIPLCGRIAALADVYDALTTNRVYKRAFSHADAISVITERSHGHFDPVVSQAFLTEEEQFAAICTEFVEEEIANPFKNLAAVFALPQDLNLSRDDTYLPGLDRR